MDAIPKSSVPKDASKRINLGINEIVFQYISRSILKYGFPSCTLKDTLDLVYELTTFQQIKSE